MTEASTQPISSASFFKDNYRLNINGLQESVPEHLSMMDFGELYCSFGRSENLVLQQGIIRSASASSGQGFGLRGVLGEKSFFAHSNNLNVEKIQDAAKFLNEAKQGTKNMYLDLKSSDVPLISQYQDIDTCLEYSIEDRVSLLKSIDQYARQLDSRVKEVSARLTTEYSKILIIDEQGRLCEDTRPGFTLVVHIIVQDGDKRDMGYYGFGGRRSSGEAFQPDQFEFAVEEAYRKAMVRLGAKVAPGGEMPVVLKNGSNGVLFHEAVGHGLEADANYEKNSVYHDKMGQIIANEKVTLKDSGLHPGTFGALTVDDEGTPAQETTLIKDGVLTSYLYDRRTAYLMGHASTGSGRRESYSSVPYPRMRNTYLVNGPDTAEDIIASVDQGILVADVSGGLVNTAEGSYVFDLNEAYEIKNGKVGDPIKGATLIGKCDETLKEISMVAGDSELDSGLGYCVKNGQAIKVGVGQPTVKVDRLTVGGTKTG